MALKPFKPLEYVSVVCPDCRTKSVYFSRKAGQNMKKLHLTSHPTHRVVIVRIDKEQYLEALKA